MARCSTEKKGRVGPLHAAIRRLAMSILAWTYDRCPDEELGNTEQYVEMLRRTTRAVREADEAFQKSGGSSRHWVGECFLPVLWKHGLKLEAV